MDTMILCLGKKEWIWQRDRCRVSMVVECPQIVRVYPVWTATGDMVGRRCDRHSGN